MTDRPDWLPSLVRVSGEWPKVLASLYVIFERDFKQTERSFGGFPVRWDDRVLEGKYEEGFWHLITKHDHETNERLPDLRRAERLPWCGPTITHATDNAVKSWSYKEGKGHIRTYLWLEDFDYVIILEKRKRMTLLITAYYVEGDSNRRSLRQKYKNRVA